MLSEMWLSGHALQMFEHRKLPKLRASNVLSSLLRLLEIDTNLYTLFNFSFGAWQVFILGPAGMA